VLLNASPIGDMKWDDAVKWAEGLGDGARLPTRFESALLYANLQDKFDTTAGIGPVRSTPAATPGARASTTAARTLRQEGSRRAPAPSAD
jgi:hypothetical protein